MRGVFLAPLAILLKLDLSGDELLVLAGPVIDPFAFGTGEFYESIL
jgi:hypothetical protein